MKTNSLTLTGFLNRFLLQCPQESSLLLPQRRAAVLVPVVARPQPGLLLTRRSSLLRQHAGQVAFPGGMMDATDSSLTETALREAMEEVAIPPEAVHVIGVLPAVTSSTGFQVTPVVGIIPPNIAYRISKNEVDALFEMPLQEALRLSRYFSLDVHRHGRQHRVWFSWYQHYLVWGMTAGIIRQLSLQVSADPLR